MGGVARDGVDGAAPRPKRTVPLVRLLTPEAAIVVPPVGQKSKTGGADPAPEAEGVRRHPWSGATAVAGAVGGVPAKVAAAVRQKIEGDEAAQAHLGRRSGAADG